MTTTRNVDGATATDSRVGLPVRNRDMIITITPKSDDTAAVIIDTDNVDGLAATYGAATTGEKTKIRNAITAGMTDAVRAMDLELAQTFARMGDVIKSVGATPKTEIDFNRVVADRILAFRYAAHRLIMGDVTPDGIDADKIDLDAVRAMIDESDAAGDPDAVSDSVATAGNRLATAKITRSTERGSVDESIARAFADVPVGTVLTVSQIKTRSGAKSAGAIGVRLWPAAGKSVTVDLTALGVELTDVDGVRAVRKVADIEN